MLNSCPSTDLLPTLVVFLWEMSFPWQRQKCLHWVFLLWGWDTAWKTMGSWNPTLIISTAGLFKDSLATHKHGKKLGHQLEHSYPSWQTWGSAGSAFCRRSKHSYSKDGSSRLCEVTSENTFCGPDVFVQEFGGAQGREWPWYRKWSKGGQSRKGSSSQMQLEIIFQEFSSYVISKNLGRRTTQRHSIPWTFHS